MWMYLDFGLFFIFMTISIVDGFGNSCEDIDHQACVAMAMQNANLCAEPILAKTACPKYCQNCPISCYNCNISTYDVSPCNTVTCNRDEVCMKKTIQIGGGYRHILRCESKTVCDQNKAGTSICCTGDLCNIPAMPSTTRSTDPRPTTSIRLTTAVRSRPTTVPTTSIRTTTAVTPRPTTVPTTSMWPTTVVTPRPTTPLLPVCPRDLILMIDQSDNVWTDKVNLRNNLADMIGLMKIGGGSDETQVALVTFDSTVHEHWNFNNGYNDKASLLQAIRSLSVTPSNGKATDNSATGVYLTHTDYFKPGNRINIPDVVMIITGTEDPPGLSKQQTMLQKLHSLYSNVIVVGIGPVLRRPRIWLATFKHVDILQQGEVLQFDFVKSFLMNLICS